MTMAICFRCGATKFGGFALCEECGARPESDDDLITSLLLTDHYHDATALGDFAARIKRGERPEMRPETRQRLREELERLKRDKVFARLMGLEPPKSEGPGE